MHEIFGAAPTVASFEAGVAQLLPRAMLALVVGGVLAWRPWRALLGLPPVRRDMAQAQALLCVAGCVMVTVVGDNVARAFGLVGLGGLIRFRAALKDPRDGAIFFLVIGLGMAAGLGATELVVTGGLFLATVLAALEKLTPVGAKPPPVRMLLRCEHPREVDATLRAAFARAQVGVRASTADEVEQTLELVLDEGTPGAAAAVVAAAQVTPRTVHCELVLKEE